MPLLQAAQGDSDGGYAVADYRAVRADLGTMDDLRTLARSLRERGISLVLDLVLNHVAREHEWAQAAREGSERHRAYFHVFDRPRAARRLRATLPEVFPDFAPGSFTWDDDLRRLGLDDVQLLPVGRQLVQPRGARSSTPRSCSSWPTPAWRCCGWTPSRSCGSGWAPPARTSPRCTRSPRRCAPWPGSPVPQSRSRPRRSSGRTTSCTTSAGARTTARSATSPTTTPSWCRSGRCWPAATRGWPRTRCARCRRRRPRARGSPTCAATTTSAGRSTTGRRRGRARRPGAPAVPVRLVHR